MRKCIWSLVILSVMVLVGCGGPSGAAPEEFALQVTRCVAEGDWPTYRDLALARAKTLATDANPTGTRNTFQKLTALEEGAIRRDFERSVRARVVRVDAMDRYTAVIHATEPDRWVLHIQGPNDEFTGLEMILRRHGDGYRVVMLSIR